MPCNQSRYVVLSALGIMLLYNAFGSAFAQTSLSVEELVALVNANKERFRSLEAEFIETSSDGFRDNSLWLWTPEHSYLHSTSFQDAEYSMETEWTVEWKKTLHRTLDDSTTSTGRIIREPDGARSNYPLFHKMYEVCGLPLNDFVEKGADIEWDPATSCYILRLVRQNRSFTMTVNPLFEYMPVSWSFTVDQTNSLSAEFRDFKEVAPSLWLPSSYVLSDPEQERTTSLKIISVNQPIDEKRMQITFPPGTLVRDEVLKEKYVIGGDGNLLDGVEDNPDSKTIYRDDIYRPADELDLSEKAAAVEMQLHNNLPFLPPRRIFRYICVAGLMLSFAAFLYARRKAKRLSTTAFIAEKK